MGIMKCDELKPIDLECNMGKDNNVVEHREPWKAYDIDEVDAAIAELKQKLEDAQATAYAESVDAGMRERRLKRALYKVCENWADAEVFARVKRVNDDNTEANKWAVMRNKCRAMAEKFK
jgi:hypothetical protein